jgi:serine/threonine protein kinase
MDVRPFDILPPRTLLQERYRVARLIGRGGMGAVYEATDTRLKISVALKQTLVGGAQFRKAFQREALLLARLRHAALPIVTDYFVERDAQFLVMQFIPGLDLATQLSKRDDPLPVDDVLDWADQLLDALEYLHAQQPPVVHRDIKPQNLKLTSGGQIVLLDFGLAKGAAAQSQIVSSSSVFGFTPHYAPLEQIRGSGTSPRSDLYALAATLYHLVSGAPPISAMERAEASVNGLPDPLVPPHEVNPEIPPGISEALMQALALRTDARPESAAHMRAALQAATIAPRDWERETVLVAPPIVAEAAVHAPADALPAPEPHGSIAADTAEREAISPAGREGRARSRRTLALSGLVVIALVLIAMLGLRGISSAGGSSQIAATSAPSRVELLATNTPTPTASPTASSTPTASPSPTPSPTLTSTPTLTPTATLRPTARPRPTATPEPPTATAAPPPTEQPTALPAAAPTETPTTADSPRRPRPNPTAPPTEQPTEQPTSETYPPPSDEQPTKQPSEQPTANVAPTETAKPTAAATSQPTSEPASTPTAQP